MSDVSLSINRVTTIETKSSEHVSARGRYKQQGFGIPYIPSSLGLALTVTQLHRASSVLCKAKRRKGTKQRVSMGRSIFTL